MTWLLIVLVYVAPADAVDWKGSWELGLTHLMEQRFVSEDDCFNEGAAVEARLREGMLAPVRYHCLEVEAQLPPSR